jgi:glutathione S-transferase
MTEELVLYTHPMSRGRTARWMLEEVGEPYRTEIVDYGAPMKSPAYLAVNPMGKVPALKHGDTVVTEVAAICLYLADRFPRAGLAPAVDDPGRGAFLRWIFFAGPLEQAATMQALGVEPSAKQSGMLGFGSRSLIFDVLEKRLEGRSYVACDRFTAADVVLGAQLGWGMQFGIIEKRAAYLPYVERVTGRPAAVRARAIDDALVPKHPMPGKPAA